MKIALIRGTTRPSNYTQYVVREVKKLLERYYPELEIMEFAPDSYEIIEGNKEQNQNPAWTEVSAAVSGYIIVTPEYNHAAPGSLKELLDEDFTNYNFKPVGLVGVSNGRWGGTRAIESLLPVLKALGLVTLRRDAHMPNVNDFFDQEGNITANEEMQKVFEGEVLGMLEHFVIMVESLIPAREELA